MSTNHEGETMIKTEFLTTPFPMVSHHFRGRMIRYDPFLDWWTCFDEDEKHVLAVADDEHDSGEVVAMWFLKTGEVITPYDLEQPSQKDDRE